MARYSVTIRSPKSAKRAFDFMADLRNFAEWDPGVQRVEQVVGDGAGLDHVFDVDVAAFPRPLTLRYRTLAYEPNSYLEVEARSALLTSLDKVTVRRDGSGSIVTYDAELTLRGPLGLADPLVRLVFGRIGDRAARGLVAALDGDRVDRVDADAAA